MAMFAVISTRADWNSVNNNFQAGTDNKVKGPGKAYTVSRPEQGEWKFTADLRNHSANLSGNDINVYSVSNVTFSDYSIASGHGGMNSSIIFRLEFSEPVSQISWDISQHFLHLSEKGKFSAKYCGEDGKWRDAYKYPSPYQKDIDPEPVIIKFSKPIKTLYLGWVAEVPSGQTGFWNMNSLGTLHITGENGTAGEDKAVVKTVE